MSFADVVVAVVLAYGISSGTVVISYYANGGVLWKIHNLPVLILISPCIVALSVAGVMIVMFGGIMYLLIMVLLSIGESLCLDAIHTYQTLIKRI